MIKDHLGNVRMLLTDEKKTDMYPAATMEDASITTEETYYTNLTNTQYNKPAWFTDANYPTNAKVARLKNEAGSQKIGPNMVLKVMAGDSYNIRVSAGWNSGSAATNSSTNVLNDLLNILSTSVAGQSGGKVAAGDPQVMHTRGPILEETHYYLFGLTMAGISSNASLFGFPTNRIKYNGYEKQEQEFSDELGLEWYDYKNRFYDQQIGRFFAQDKLASEYVYYTPYQFAGNEIPNAIDLDGLGPYYSSAKQLFYQGAGDLTRAMRGLLDRVKTEFSFGGTKESVIATNGNTTISSQTTFGINASYSSNFVDFYDNLSHSSSSANLKSPLNLNFGFTYSEGLVSETKSGPLSVKQSVSVDNNGAFTSTSSVSVDNRMKNVIGDFTVSNSTNTKNGIVQSNSTTFEIGLKATNLIKAPVSVGYTQNINGPTTVNLESGVEVNVDVGKNKFKLFGDVSISF